MILNIFYYFDDIIRFKDFGLDNILIDKKSKENILVHKTSYKTLISTKPLGIRLGKVNRFIRVYNETWYLVLFEAEKCDLIYNRVRYLIGVTNNRSNNYAKIKTKSKSKSFLTSRKKLTFHNVIIIIKLVFSKDKINYCNIFLEKGLNEIPKYNDNEKEKVFAEIINVILW